MKKKPPAPPLPFRLLFTVFPYLEKFALPVAKYIVVRLFFTPFRFKPRPEEIEIIKSAREFQLSVNGHRVVGHVWGAKGPLAVLVHGWSGRGTQLRQFVKPLSQRGYRVIAFDAPGHGQSDGQKSSLLEFRDSLLEIEKTFGAIEVGIGHSLGGASLVYAAKEGLNIPKIITLSTPTIPLKIIEEFLRRINGSMRSGIAIDNYVQKVTGHNFEYFSALYNAGFLKNTAILSFHDTDDKEAGIEHARALKKSNPRIKLIETQGLGHNRILKDEAVVDKTVEWCI